MISWAATPGKEEDMTTLMDVLRIECGVAGEEAAELITSLEKQNDIIKDERDAITKERDELRSQRFTDQQRQGFEAVTQPVIKWLCDNCHPHVTVVIDPISAVLSEGSISFVTHYHLLD